MRCVSRIITCKRAGVLSSKIRVAFLSGAPRFAFAAQPGKTKHRHEHIPTTGRCPIEPTESEEVVRADRMPDMHLALARVNTDKAAIQAAPDLMFADTTIEDVLADKSKRSLITVGEDSTVLSAIRLMDKQAIGAVLVKNARGDCTGIFTERDYLRKILLRGLSSRETPIIRVMTPNPLFLTTKETATRAMGLMTYRRIRHLPVRDATTNAVVGVVSIGDILKTVINQFKVRMRALFFNSVSGMRCLQETTAQYRNFVSGKYPDAHTP
jgi:CBS domain-containing protein